jgi:hypothetical protein
LRQGVTGCISRRELPRTVLLLLLNSGLLLLRLLQLKLHLLLLCGLLLKLPQVLNIVGHTPESGHIVPLNILTLG